jgi:hypothetical protein
MEEAVQKADSMEENNRKTVEAAKEAGWETTKASPSLSLPLPPRPETPQKVYKSVQNTPGNHPSTQTKSMT